MERIFFTILINDELKKFSIIGALSENEESLITQFMADLHRNGIGCQRISCNLDNSINETINFCIENNPGYQVVPVNKLFEDINFITIPAIERE